MKIIKNIFNPKPKQNTKYEPNTLAEINGSPDLRLATAKEKEVDIHLPKSDEVKKISKTTTKSIASKTGKSTSKSKSTVKTTTNSEEVVKEVATASTSKEKANSSTSKTKSEATKKSTSKTTLDKKESTMKSNAKKTSEPKKTATAAKKTEPATKSTTSKSTKSAAVNKKVKSEPKSSSTVKKNDASSEKKAVVEKKPVTTPTKKSTEEKQSAAKAEKSATKNKVESKDTEVITESKTTRSGKFEIKKSKDGRFVFNLYASNNVIVATSQVYSSSPSAVNGIKSVIANASTAQIEDQSLKKVTPVPFPKWEIYQDKGEQYRFRLCASNGSCVVHSQGYTSKANCKKGIESIIKFASEAEITKVYLDKK